jgi:hypothetical protein
MDICVDNVSKADPQLLEKANEDSAMAPLVGIMSDTGIPKTFFLPVGIPRPTMHTGDVKVGNAIMLSRKCSLQSGPVTTHALNALTDSRIAIRKVRTPAALKIHCTTPKSARPYRLRDISIGKRHLTNRKRDASGERVRTLGSPTRSDTMSSSEDLLQTPSRVGMCFPTSSDGNIIS